MDSDSKQNNADVQVYTLFPCIAQVFTLAVACLQLLFPAVPDKTLMVAGGGGGGGGG